MYFEEVVKKSNGNFVPIAIVLAIIGILLVTGPANALNLAIDGLGASYVIGDWIFFEGSINIDSNEVVNIQNVSLEINGNIACTFNVDGENITACPGIDSELLESTVEEGYGYGYGNGKLVYKIIIITPQIYLNAPGSNTAKLVASSEDEEFTSSSKVFALVKDKEDKENETTEVNDKDDPDGNDGHIKKKAHMPSFFFNNSDEEGEDNNFEPLASPIVANEQDLPVSNDNTPENNEDSTRAGITGGVIGILTSTGGILIAILLVLGAGAGLTYRAIQNRKALNPVI